MPGRPPIILNVDDDEAARYTKSRALSRAPELQVIEAASGEEALQLVAARRPLLVLLDVKLPDMSGLDVCRIIKLEFPDTLVLQTSASLVSGGDRTRGLEAGADSYLAQPCEPEELVASVRALLRIRAAEAALRESEANFRTLAENIPTLCWMANAQGKIYWYNKRWYEYTGLPAGELLGWKWRSLHDRTVVPQLFKLWRASLATGTPFEMVFPLRGADGIFRPFLTRVAPVTDDDGRIVRWFGTNADISKQTAVENELRELNETLEQRVQEEVMRRAAAEESIRQFQKMEALGQLTGGIAHDFNNMLAVVIGGLSLLKRNLERGRTDVGRFIDGAMDGAERAASLTQRLLAFSRRQPLSIETVCANTMIGGMTDLLSRTLGERIRVTTSLQEDMWAIRTDKSQLENAILNMAVNARDAMSDGGELRIETAKAILDAPSARRYDLPPGDYVSIAVIDTGAGMSPEVLQRAFDPFFTTKGVGKGTGLGLSQIFGFVRQSGGHVTIASTLGEGTTVRIFLPRDEESPNQTHAPEDGRIVASEGNASETILVVEDDDRVRRMTVEALQGLGYSVIEAPSSAEALAVVEREEPIALLFTDIVMPDLNGTELAIKALAHSPDLRILFTSGYAPEHMEEGLPPHIRARTLQKPYSIEQLARRVRLAIES